MEKVFITGANGFLGSWVAEILSKKGFSVFCLIRKTSNLRWLKNLNVNLVYGDITDKESLFKECINMDYVIHTAALKRALLEEEYYKVNHIGTLNLLEACKVNSSNLKRFVYVSSLAVSGPSSINKPLTEEDNTQPITNYGKSKLKGEIEVKKYIDKLPIVILRPPVLYGPRDEDIFTFFKIVSKGIKPVLSGSRNLVNLLFIEDLVDAIIVSMLNDKATDKTYFITDEKPYSWNEIGNEIEKALGINAIRITIPRSILSIAGFLNDLFSKITGKPAALNSEKVKEMKASYWLCSSKKAKNELNWQSKFSLEQRIKETADWYKKESWL